MTSARPFKTEFPFSGYFIILYSRPFVKRQTDIFPLFRKNNRVFTFFAPIEHFRRARNPLSTAVFRLSFPALPDKSAKFLSR